jgi:hypothetical protein
MPRSTNTTLNNLLPTSESQSAVWLTLNDDTDLRWIQEDAGQRTIEEETYVEHLQITDELRQTIENPIDRVSFSIQNVDRNLGIDIVENLENYTFADCKVYRYFEAIRDENINEMKPLFRGMVSQVEIDEKDAKIELAPDYIALGDCVAAETLTGAEWKFPDLPFTSPPGSGDNDGGGFGGGGGNGGGGGGGGIGDILDIGGGVY